MAHYQISRKIRSRKNIIFYSIISLLILTLALVAFLATRNNKTVRAFVNTNNVLNVGANDVLYIGPGGYVAQRMWSQDGQPIDVNKISSFPTTNSAPTGNVYTAGNVLNLRSSDAGNVALGCPTRYLDPGTTYTGACMAIKGNGTGMIVRYDQEITISGTVFVADRVVLEAPNINITRTAKIIASGQDGHLGYGDSCGVGGIGGTLGGTSSSNNLTISHTDSAGRKYVSCNSNQNGTTAYQAPYIRPLSSAVAEYFTVSGQTIVGGHGGYSSDAAMGNALGIDGTSGLIGVGGGGASGATGSTQGDDHGSSGGAGGGFGVVFKATNLTVAEGAIITAAGGNTTVSSDGNSQYPGHNHNTTGGFGAPGGGGVIVIDAGAINFVRQACVAWSWGMCIGVRDDEPAVPNYSVFDVSGGKFDIGLDQRDMRIARAPTNGTDGKLVVISEIGKNVSIRKSLRKISGSGSPYSVQPGDFIEVTLEVSNLVVGQAVTIKDEMFNDAGVNFSTFRFCSGGCIPPSGTEITWNLTPTSTSETLTYQIEIR